jgi:hypothetical protein
VNHQITHVLDVPQGKIRKMLLVSGICLHHTVSGFSDDLDTANNCILLFIVLEKCLSANTPGIPLDAFRRMSHIFETSVDIVPGVLVGSGRHSGRASRITLAR